MKLISLKPIVKKGAIALLAVCLLIILLAWGLTGGDYELSRSTIVGGGGTCSGGDFTLTGTIGQPAAGVMTGGDFMLVGGYGVIINTAPVACIVDGNQTVECKGYWGATVTLDGSCSSDADSTPGTNDDIVYFDWYEQLDPYDPETDIFLGTGEIIDCNLPLGEHIIILEVIDKADAFDSNDVTIIVEDTTPPVVDAGSSIIVEQETYEGTTVTLNGSALDNCDAELDYEWSENGAVLGNIATLTHTFSLGTHTLTLKATDNSGNAGTDTVTVTVEDTTPPEITCPADVTVEQESYAGTVVPLEATATDICDANPVITSNELAIYPLGVTIVTFTATDASGNSATCSMTVTVVDTTPPVPNCPEDIVVSGFGAVDVNFNPTATDDCDPNPGVTTDVPSGSPFETGITTVTATATDASGNSNTCTFDVLVSCFAVNHLKIGTKADRKGDNVDIKGTFAPAVPPDLAVDDVMYSIKDGQGHTFTFSIPADSFKVDGKPDKQKFKFDSLKGSEPDIKAKFDFLKCKFELKVKGVMNTSEITAETMAIELQAGANVVEDVVQVQVKPKHLEFKRKPELSCCPEM